MSRAAFTRCGCRNWLNCFKVNRLSTSVSPGSMLEGVAVVWLAARARRPARWAPCRSSRANPIIAWSEPISPGHVEQATGVKRPRSRPRTASAEDPGSSRPGSFYCLSWPCAPRGLLARSPAFLNSPSRPRSQSVNNHQRSKFRLRMSACRLGLLILTALRVSHGGQRSFEAISVISFLRMASAKAS